MALPLARLMAHRVWASVETLNQQLTVLEQHCFTRMTSDPAFEGQGARFAQLLRVYATLTEAVAALGQRLAQNRLTAMDRQLLATGDLALLLPPASAEPTSPAADPAPAVTTPPTATLDTDTEPGETPVAAIPERPRPLLGLPPVGHCGHTGGALMPPARGLALALALLASGALLASAPGPTDPLDPRGAPAPHARPARQLDPLASACPGPRLGAPPRLAPQYLLGSRGCRPPLLPDNRALAPCRPATRATRPGRLPGAGLSLAGRADADPGNRPGPRWRPARGRG